MMNIPPEQAGRLSLWEYETLLWHWDEAHSSSSDVEAPNGERAQAIMDRINADPRLTGKAATLQPA